jgi:hypothetical protein
MDTKDLNCKRLWIFLNRGIDKPAEHVQVAGAAAIRLSCDGARER